MYGGVIIRKRANFNARSQSQPDPVFAREGYDFLPIISRGQFWGSHSVITQTLHRVSQIIGSRSGHLRRLGSRQLVNSE